MDSAALLFPFAFSLSLNDQCILVDFYLHVFLVQSRWPGGNHQIAFALAALYRRRPQARFTPAESTYSGKHPVHILGEPAHQSERAHGEHLLRMAPEQTRKSPLAAAHQSTNQGTLFETAAPLFRSCFDICFSHGFFSIGCADDY